VSVFVAIYAFCAVPDPFRVTRSGIGLPSMLQVRNKRWASAGFVANTNLRGY